MFQVSSFDRIVSISRSWVAGVPSSPLQIMMGRISKQLQHVHDRLRSLPDELTCGDFFSGAGTFAKVVDVAFHAFQQAFPDAMSGKTVAWCMFKLCAILCGYICAL